jgi:hypothetical protein
LGAKLVRSINARNDWTEPYLDRLSRIIWIVVAHLLPQYVPGSCQHRPGDASQVEFPGALKTEGSDEGIECRRVYLQDLIEQAKLPG